MTSRVYHTPAKVNLFLAIPARRADGFHELETLMAAVSIFDTLVFTPCAGTEIDLSCEWAAGIAAQATSLRGSSSRSSPWDPLPPAGQNLVLRALQLLQRTAGIAQGAQVRLIKRIPAAAGLGGASSDAATALLAANNGWGLGWPLERLAGLAAEIGSDVPFFLPPAAAICRGRGERIERASLGALHLVVVRPSVGLSTAEVYRHCQPQLEAIDSMGLVQALRDGNRQQLAESMTNRLQPPAELLASEVGRLLAALARQDGVATQMSGSGSSCFGIARSARQVRRMAARLRAEGWQAVYRTAMTDRVERS